LTTLLLQGVRKSFGPIAVLQDVSLEVSDGEILVLVGPSGCGKSTLLRIIAGLETLDAGSVHLDGRNVTYVDPKDRDVAMVFQNYALYPHMTVYQNMAFSLEQRGFLKEEIRERVTDTARKLNLETLIDRKPGALSGGQRQRVAMGRAIVRSPKIFLMDEPLSNLDAKLRVQMRAELKLLRARLGVTTIYVTHDQIEAMTLGDRVAVLAASASLAPGSTNLQQVGTPQKLYHEPLNMFVAGFIGSPAMNFMYATVTGTEQALSLVIEGTNWGFQLTLTNSPSLKALLPYAGQRIVVGIRPEFFSPAIAADDGQSDTVTADILVAEFVGQDAYLHFDLPTPAVEIAAACSRDDSRDERRPGTRFTARVSSEEMQSLTGPVNLRVDLRRVHYFDQATTNRIQ
jgi:multiple sugar transport system ATP-binding protein